jgi:diguanylate cyclase (GGDEF)-like protein
MSELHWSMQVMDTIDVGLVVVDREYNVCLWNNFMQSYSGVNAEKIMQKSLFSVIDHLPEVWLKEKINTCAELRTRSFSHWEDCPHVFEFKNYSPVSNGLDIMYQNLVMTPLQSLRGDISHVCIMIQDVSDIAKNKMTLRESNLHLSELSQRDGLTGLLNRAYWEKCLLEHFNTINITNSSSTLVMFDIDHFKKVNDTYGHGAGDEVIRKTAQLLMQTARRSDYCGRYGGEEFTVFLPDTSADQAHYFAERLRKRIEALVVETEAGKIKFTVSLGICQFDSTITSHLEWLEHTDKALYHSKKSGRNQSTTHPIELSSHSLNTE